MKTLMQHLDTKDDSFSYTLLGETDPLYRVDSSGYLTERGVQIGKFCLRGKVWDLVLADGKVFHGLDFGMFGLPEFEHYILSKLANQTA